MEAIGGSFVVYLGTVGLLKFRRPPVSMQRGVTTSLSGEAADQAENPLPSPSPRLTRSFFSMFGLTLTNPMTMLSFLALAASLHATAAADSLTLAAGIFLGSSAWWLLLCLAVHFAGKTLPANLQRYLQLLSSVLLLAFGLVRTCGALLVAAA
jgi:threonine/homoserine/homoserine lactone efflux protein